MSIFNSNISTNIKYTGNGAFGKGDFGKGDFGKGDFGQ